MYCSRAFSNSGWIVW